MDSLCIFSATCAPSTQWFVLVIPVWVFLGALLSWPKQTTTKIQHPAVSILFWVLAAAFSVLPALVIPAYVASGPSGIESKNHLQGFFQQNQVTLLAMIIALAAYTSSVAQKIREAMKDLAEDKRGEHINNLQWLQKSDVSLVLAGIAVMIRIAESTLGYHDDCFDRVIIGLVAWIIFYFAFLHIRQLLPQS
jgi:hypothetical protein